MCALVCGYWCWHWVDVSILFSFFFLLLWWTHYVPLIGLNSLYYCVYKADLNLTKICLPFPPVFWFQVFYYTGLSTLFVFMPDLSLNLVLTVSTRLPVEMLLYAFPVLELQTGAVMLRFFFFNLENLDLKYLCLCTKHFTNRAISLDPMLRDLQSLLDYCSLEK